MPTSQKPDWLKTYETLADYVVPRSSVEVVSDPDYTLFTVTLFQRCIDEFKTNCAKKKFTIRDVGKMLAQTSGSAGSDQNNNELSSEALLKKLRKDKARQFPILVKWLQLNYRDCVSIMMHLKSLKCYIESVLRYGLPVKFDSIIIQPPNKAVGKLKMVLGGVGNRFLTGWKNFFFILQLACYKASSAYSSLSDCIKVRSP